jgi:hypothetical protein
MELEICNLKDLCEILIDSCIGYIYYRQHNKQLVKQFLVTFLDICLKISFMSV